jgi:hypothetical protein
MMVQHDIIERFLISQGYDPDNGDVLMLPESYQRMGIKHKNVIYNPLIEQPMLVKKPSLFEGLPLALVEAQINQLPCIISSNIDEDSIISEKVYRIKGFDNVDLWTTSIIKNYKSRFLFSSILNKKLSLKLIIKKLITIYRNFGNQ